jgi:DNA-binding LacI/PurR family transcriptional regulator
MTIMATIRDVARYAGVHPSTVSRVFSGKASISSDTQQRVLNAAKELGFHPNAIARSLSTRRTNTIGMVIPYIYQGFFNDSFFPQTMQGMLEASYQYGYRLILGGSQGYQDEYLQIRQIMDSRQADGIVVMSSRLDVDTVGALYQQGTPFVLIGHPPASEYASIPWVDANNQQATRQAIEHLIGLGHRHIAYIGGDPENLTTQERLLAYQETLELAGIKIDQQWVEYGYFSEEGGYLTAHHMLNHRNPPTAFYAANDPMAIGALRAIQERGLNIPQQISIIGTNDSPATVHTRPPLTSIKVPYADIAAKAVEMLVTLIEQGELIPTSHTLDCSLVMRDSTGAIG